MMIPDYPILFWLCAIAAMLIVGAGKAGFGGVVGAATPLLALAIPVTDAAALMLPLLIITDCFTVYHYRLYFHRKSIQFLLPGAVIGIGAGGIFFGFFADNERILEVGLGVLAVFFVLFNVFRAVIFGAVKKKQPKGIEGILMGALSGFTSTLLHAGGPPVSMYLLPQKLPNRLYVGTTVIFFALVNLIKLIPYYSLGLLKMGNMATIIILAPIVYAGVRLGIFLNTRFSDIWFNRVIYSLLFITGIKLICGDLLF